MRHYEAALRQGQVLLNYSHAGIARQLANASDKPRRTCLRSENAKKCAMSREVTGAQCSIVEIYLESEAKQLPCLLYHQDTHKFLKLIASSCLSRTPARTFVLLRQPKSTFLDSKVYMAHYLRTEDVSIAIDLLHFSNCRFVENNCRASLIVRLGISQRARHDASFFTALKVWPQ